MNSIVMLEDLKNESMDGFRGGTLGIVAETLVWRHEGRLYTNTTFGRMVDGLASQFKQVILCTPLAEGSSASSYEVRATNIEVIPQPAYSSMIAALRQPLVIVRAYWNVCQRADSLFVRGMIPFSAFFYAIARVRHRRPCHWIVGNQVALLKSHRRAGWLRDAFSLVYSTIDRWCTRWGNRLSGGSFVCNGEELGQVYKSPRTLVTVSSSLTEDEFFEREDTCQGSTIRILLLSVLRPEKGIQYLLEAVARLKIDRPWELVIVGGQDRTSKDQQVYIQGLHDMVDRFGIADRVHWKGRVTYGPELFECFRSADLFVLPTLSEGTPHVLIEARANSLPIVATRVGGIPTMVTDGEDGLLVPSKEVQPLTDAMESIIRSPELRRRLIRNGRERMANFTVDRFVERVLTMLETGDPTKVA